MNTDIPGGNRPGGALATRPLHFFFLVDCSGSMANHGKIEALNTAMREAIPHMKTAAASNPNATVKVGVIAFSSVVRWHIPSTELERFSWSDLNALGETDMGRALTMVAEQLKMPPMESRALPPVLVLISDGQPTDDLNTGLRNLNEVPWGKKAVRIALAIGHDADNEVLQKFIGVTSEVRPLQVHNVDQLVRYIRWASTAVLNVASQPSVQSTNEAASGHVPIPNAPEAGTVEEIW